MKKICVVTGTRAEYGLLRPLIKRLNNDKDIELQIIATGMHLSHEFGLTYKNIEQDGYKIDEKIEILLSSDSNIGISKSMGLVFISFSETYERLKPDMIVILGDRYETFAAVATAVIAKIPVVHIHGGEITEGAFDDSFRHSMTKMSYLHFTSTEEYRRRVIQLGEFPERVFNVGALGVENALNIRLKTKKEIENKFNFTGEYFLIIFHPVTLENNSAEKQIKNLLKALENFKDKNFIFIKGNSDTNGRVINQVIDEYVKKNSNSLVFTSLYIEEYMSLLKNSKMIIGNSSSGIIEAPSFKIPTVNIGDRQKGRIKAKSIIDCKPEEKEIIKAINKALSQEFQEMIKDIENPYGDGNTSEKIVGIIKCFLEKQKINLKKKFYDIEFEV
jgi:GDP/UDP-N,N'-diacetylbacillosamine 2-epimerase (hydrolysing)